ncbi:MAG: hypothetical protein C0507_18215 [Cyanobacteria bacterium PR.3.49]|jgi:SHS2 domain-containing protein|nr:hypothetical protein [Cyanobacteria bacterium PR.3.49]
MHIDADLSPDLGFKVSAERVDKLFEEAAMAFANVILDTHTVLRKETKRTELFSSSLDELMHAWLSEVNYLFQYEKFLPAEFVVEISGDETGGYRLNGTISGEYLDGREHYIHKRVKTTLVKEHKLERLEDGSLSASVYVYTSPE